MTNQEIIDEIMDCFDFHRVKVAMEALDWRWAHLDGAIPEEFEIRQKARTLIKEALETKRSLATAGFKVDYFPHGVTLAFVVDDWTAPGD